MSRNQFYPMNNTQSNHLASSNNGAGYYFENSIMPKNNFSSNFTPNANSMYNSYNSNTNENIYQARYPNSSFDFDKKMDYLLLTNAFTKLRNENKTYEELENLALKLEISNIKYSQKLENMKFEIIRMNQRIIDLNSVIKENEIENKKLTNQINFLEKDRELMFSRIQTQELNFFNSENKMIQGQAMDQDNNLIDKKYLVRTSNDLDNNPLTGYITENSKEINKYESNNNNEKKDRRRKEIRKADFDDVNSNEENENKKQFNSIIEDTDSSLIEGFENNESLLDSIKRRENKTKNNSNNNAPKNFSWKDVLTCDEKEKKTFLNKINNYDAMKKENKRLQKEVENCNSELLDLNKENKSLANMIKEKDEIIQILYKEIDNLKKENFYLNQEMKQSALSKNEFDKFSDPNELSDISPTTPDVDSEYNSPALKKIKHFIKDHSHNKNNNKNQNTPSTVNKNFFYKNNTNYENFLKRNSHEDNENCKTSSLLIKNSYNKSVKSNEELAKEKTFKKKQLEKYSNYENDEYNEKNEYQGLNTDLTDKPRSVRVSKNNFTFQENDILRQNDSSNLYSYQNNINNSDYALKCENDKKFILKSLEDLKKDLDLFLKGYGIKEQFNKEIPSAFANNNIDFQIEYKFKEIRYITVNLKKINIIFKSLFVEFTRNIASNMDILNENVSEKLYVLQNKIRFASGEITEVIFNN